MLGGPWAGPLFFSKLRQANAVLKEDQVIAGKAISWELLLCEAMRRGQGGGGLSERTSSCAPRLSFTGDHRSVPRMLLLNMVSRLEEIRMHCQEKIGSASATSAVNLIAEMELGQLAIFLEVLRARLRLLRASLPELTSEKGIPAAQAAGRQALTFFEDGIASVAEAEGWLRGFLSRPADAQNTLAFRALTRSSTFTLDAVRSLSRVSRLLVAASFFMITCFTGYFAPATSWTYNIIFRTRGASQQLQTSRMMTTISSSTPTTRE